ncbi:MAG: SGNH/GDSL hydrolase family protein [Planctomycetes bacterium]|nr:SGNH/GDSL hydrolase family protein [Planctomycetota bacterium]
MTRLPIGRRRKALYAALVTLTTLAVAELGARGFVAAAVNPRWRHHEQLVAAVGLPALNEILEPDPELFWRLRANVEARRVTGAVGDSGQLAFTVSTDAAGRRITPGGVDDGGTARRVLLLGDSCTFGLGVESDRTFAALLQERLPDTRCINAGVPGYSSFQGHHQFDEMELARPPVATIVTFLFNDKSHWDGRSDPEQAAARRGVGAWLARHSRLFQLLAALVRGTPDPAADSPQAPQVRRERLSDREYEVELRAIVRRCATLGSTPILVVWPLRSQIGGGDGDRAARRKQEVVRRLAGELELPLVDLVATFRGAAASGLFLDVVHANERGHALVAGAIEPVLRPILSR